MKLMKVEEALQLFLKHVKIKETEIEYVSLNEALHRVLGEDIISPTDLPPFDRAAMDGFAVKSTDTFGASELSPVELKIIGESEIGRPFKGVLESGCAVRIDTGAKIPDGADAVVPKEYTKEFDDRVLIFKSVVPFENTAKKGEDVKRGEIILHKGKILEPYDIALLKALGISQVPVKKKPKIAVFSIGNELIEEFNPKLLEEGKIVDTNRIMICSLIKENGGECIDFGIIPDDSNEIRNALIKSTNFADIICTIGGISIGKRDFVAKVVNEIGTLIVRGVAIQPGKPVSLGVINGKPVVCLPGFPVSAFIAYCLFVKPLIFKMLGIKREYQMTVKGKLSRRLPGRLGRRVFVRVKLKTRDGDIIVEPLKTSGAGILSSLCKADGILIIPENLEGFEKGFDVDVITLKDFHE